MLFLTLVYGFEDGFLLNIYPPFCSESESLDIDTSSDVDGIELPSDGLLSILLNGITTVSKN